MKAVLLVALAAAGPAAAYTPYIAPTHFAVSRDFVTLTAAETRGRYFLPDFPIRIEGAFFAVGPTGARVDLGPGQANKEFTVVEAALPQEGTWRITTGDRAGRDQDYAHFGGRWRRLLPGWTSADYPPGSPLMTAKFFMKAETFVTRGAPSDGALRPTGQGFEFTPQTNPGELYAGDVFRFSLTQDGRPAARTEFRLFRAGDAYAARRFTVVGRTDVAGLGQVKLAEPGVYVLETRYPDTGEPAPETTVYTVSFEVTR